MRVCPICYQPDGRHWSVPHNHMTQAEQERRRRWFSDEEAEAWLKRQLADLADR